MEVKDIMDQGIMIIPIILFIGGILVSWSLGGMGIGLVEKNGKQ
ncbi:MAG: hypothetical protein ACYDCF_04440 [Burkholderiales bacterium]